MISYFRLRAGRFRSTSVLLIVCSAFIVGTCTAAPIENTYKTVCDLEDEAAAKNSQVREVVLPPGEKIPRLTNAAENDWKTQPRLLSPRRLPDKPKELRFDPENHTGLINIKFVEGTEVSIEDGRFVSKSNADIRAINEAIEASGVKFSIAPTFSRPAADLKADKACGERRSGEEMPDLSLWYDFLIDRNGRSTDALERMMSLSQLLNSLKVIETAAFRQRTPVRTFSDLYQLTPDYTSQMGYFASSTANPPGMDFTYSHALGNAGKGANVRVIDIEYFWATWPEDMQTPFWLKQPTNSFCASPQYPAEPYTFYARAEYNHGTQAVSVLIADDENITNGITKNIGIKGVVPRASWGGSSGYRDPVCAPPLENETTNFPDAIDDAIVQLRPGDFLMFEIGPCANPQLIPGGSGNLASCSSVPADYEAAYFDRISLATSLGIISVLPAANSDIDLSAPGFNGRYTVGHPNYMDSGAIIVGARNTDGSPASFSNYGARVDASAWGNRNVWGVTAHCNSTDLACFATGTTDNEKTFQSYQSAFGGTSGATPLVTGALIALQGLQKQRGGPLITPKVARQLVRMIGTPHLTGKSIGMMPDVKAMHLWMIADTDGDGVANIDELIAGRNPNIDERKALVTLLEDE
jgi:serine protease